MTSRQSRSSRAPGLRVALRRAMVPLIAATLGGAALAALPAQVAGAAAQTKLWVSSGGSDAANNCTVKASPCATITHALTFAAPTGTTIKVLAGPIVEQVTVNKSNVTIDGGGFSIKPNTQATNGTTPEAGPLQAIVSVVPGMTGVVLKHVTLDGSNVPTGGACSGGKGHIGLYIQSSNATLSKVNVVHISQGPGLRGCQNGSGIYVRSLGGNTATVSITGGTVSDYDKNGITCNDATTTCTISKVKVIGRGPIGNGDAAQNGIQLGFGAGGSISKANVSKHEYTGPAATDAAGILLYDSAANVSVTGSTLTTNNEGIFGQNDGTSTGTVANLIVTGNTVQIGVANPQFGGVGIDLDSVTGATVQNNKLLTNPSVGIALFGVLNSTIANNVATSNGTGILVSGSGSVNPTSSGNTVSSNTVSKSSSNGIQADSGTSANTFSTNMLSQNVPFDAQDSSVGLGTAGTNNTWTGNSCTGGGGNPAGIC
jgi:parallel beta-helix repeat protein